jgi:hypothetical protein
MLRVVVNLLLVVAVAASMIGCATRRIVVGTLRLLRSYGKNLPVCSMSL